MINVHGRGKIRSRLAVTGQIARRPACGCGLSDEIGRWCDRDDGGHVQAVTEVAEESSGKVCSPHGCVGEHPDGCAAKLSIIDLDRLRPRMWASAAALAT